MVNYVERLYPNIKTMDLKMEYEKFITEVLNLNNLNPNDTQSLDELEGTFILDTLFSGQNGIHIPKLLYQSMFNLPDNVINTIEEKLPGFFLESLEYYENILNAQLQEICENHYSGKNIKLYFGHHDVGGSYGLLAAF